MRKHSLFIPFFYLLMTNFLFAIEANVSYATFKGIAQENYVEVYLHIDGKTVNFEKQDGGYQAAIEITLLFKQGDEIQKFDKYVLKSPIVSNHHMSNIAIFDLKRLHLPNGEYSLEVELMDFNDFSNKNSYRTPLSMQYSEAGIQLSDIELLGSYEESEEENKYTKHGLDLKPYTYPIYPSYQQKLTFFTEIYNASSSLDKPFLVRYFLHEEAKEPMIGTLGFRKQEIKELNAFFAQLDISNVPSGSYLLTVEVRNHENKLLVQKSRRIERSNLLDYDLHNYEKVQVEETFVEQFSGLDLRRNLQALAPRMAGKDIPLLNQVIRSRNASRQRQLLLHYWTGFDELEPSAPFDEYMEVVAYVNEHFKAGFNRGYETDRGYVFLKYGKPQDIIISDSEPTAPPYQIWTYDILDTKQRNVKFVFYNPSLAYGNFELLHSTARGEVFDPQWQKKIYRSVPSRVPKNDVEGTTVDDHFGGNRAGIYYQW